ncbi:hypothetical protein ACFONL_22795 [Camelimonas fluminis]|uniref:Uncharacterized protein n=1 Tax=Camelimonas fluminis TaxID=1576911 RepID=A0ABV7UPC9_9HYPH|nr:hypothetical protein [Camelimonas fluminis]
MWHYYKEPIVEFFAMSRDALHVHLGLAIFFCALLLLNGRRHAVIWAWVMVLCAQTINELLDFHDWYIWVHAWNWKKSLMDCAHTLLWPSVFACWIWFAQRRASKSV